jgi:hypothetical protein
LLFANRDGLDTEIPLLECKRILLNPGGECPHRLVIP